MKALITGASSGIGRDMAKILSEQGYDLIVVARRKSRLEELQNALSTNVQVIDFDLSDPQNCFVLYEQVKDQDIDILINNAGYGIYGPFDETDLRTELNMIDLNIKAVHILTKMFLKDFKKADKGYILNVASASAFFPGPMMETYYGTKAYVYRLSISLFEELKRENSNVYVGAFCPGPVHTEFHSHTRVKPSFNELDSYEASAYALKKMFAKKTVIVPGSGVKSLRFFSRFIPDSIQAHYVYNMQQRRK